MSCPCLPDHPKKNLALIGKDMLNDFMKPFSLLLVKRIKNVQVLLGYRDILSSLLREASSKVGIWRTYIENQYGIVISAIENIVSIPMTLVILLRASRVSLGVDISLCTMRVSLGVDIVTYLR
jgi:hypothetical protein